MLSIKEIYDEIEAFQDREKEKAQILFSVAHKNSCWNAYAFASPKEMPRLTEDLPDLYGADKDENLPEGQKKMEQWEIDKLRFSLFVAAHNNAIKKEGGHDHE